MASILRFEDGSPIPYSVTIWTDRDGVRCSIEGAERTGKTRAIVALELEAVVMDLRRTEGVLRRTC